MSEVAGQGIYTVKGLRENGYETNMVVWRKNIGGYDVDIDLKIGNQKFKYPVYAAKMACFAIKALMKYDVYHFHYGYSLIPYHFDLPIIKLLKKDYYTEFHGSEIRFLFNSIEYEYIKGHWDISEIKKKAQKRLKKLLKEDEFDIIHIHMSYKGSFYRKYYVTKLCKKYGKKVIVHLHGSEFKDFYNNGDQKRKSMIVELFTITDCTIVLGEQWKQFINKIAPQSNVVVINNAVHIPEIGEKEESQERVLLFLGALIKRKGMQDLLKALNKMQQNGINGWHMLIAGSGEEEVALKEYVKKNSLEEQVEFLGWINKDKKNDLLMKSDVLILPSYNEGLPMAILEAMSYGLAIVSTDVGSINEAVNNGLNGYVYNPGDVEALERIITKLVADDELWKKQSRESRRICIEKFSEDTMFARIDKIWTSLYGE